MRITVPKKTERLSDVEIAADLCANERHYQMEETVAAADLVLVFDNGQRVSLCKHCWARLVQLAGLYGQL